MKTNLTETSLKHSLDGGFRALPWYEEKPSGFFAGIDFDKILSSQDSRKIVQALPVQPLFFSIKNKGLQDSLGVLPLLSKDQVCRILDYDAWTEDRLDIPKAQEWLMAFRHVSEEELYKRYTDLDEEFQIAILSGKIQMLTEEEIEQLPEEVQQTLTPMPCNKIFYRVYSTDKKEVEFIESLIQAAIKCNTAYAYSLINHVAYMPPNESEFLLQQFRRARLEEDGFVTLEDSAQIFLPLDLTKLSEDWSKLQQRFFDGKVVESKDSSQNFLEQVLATLLNKDWSVDEQYELHQGFLYLANSLCAAARIEPDNVRGLNRVMQQCQSIIGLGLEYLSAGASDLAHLVLRKEHPKTLFRVGMTLIDQARKQMIKGLKKVMPEERTTAIENFYTYQKSGSILWELEENLQDFLGFEITEILKGLFNRFPMVPTSFGEDRTTQKIIFEPISSMSKYKRLTSYVDGVSALLSLLPTRYASSEKISLEKMLVTATASSMAGGYFNAEGLKSEDLQKINQLGVDKLTPLVDDIKAELKEQLRKTKAEWSIGLQYCDPSDAIDLALVIYSEFIQNFLVTKEVNGMISDDLLIMKR